MNPFRRSAHLLWLVVAFLGLVACPSPPAKPSLSNFKASPGSLGFSGGPITLSWQGQNIQKYALSVIPNTGITGLPSELPGSSSSIILTLPSNPNTQGTRKYDFTLVATGADGTQVSKDLNVSLAPAPSFEFMADTTGISVVPGETTNTTLTITPKNLFTGKVTLSIADAVPGLASLSPSEIEVSGTEPVTQAINIKTTSELALGAQTIKLVAQSGNLRRDAVVGLQVNAPQPLLESFTVTPANLPAEGGLVQLSWSGKNITKYQIAASPSTGITGLPGDLSSDITSIQLKLPPNTSVQNNRSYNLSITGLGENGTTAAMRQATATVAAAPTFNVSISPRDGFVTQGNTVDTQITITPVNNFLGDVAVSLANAPMGLTFSPNKITVNSTNPVTQKITLSAAKNSLIGQFSLNFVLSNGSIGKSSLFDLSIESQDVADSQIEISLTGLDENKLNPVNAMATLTASGGSFDDSPNSVTVLLNDKKINANANATTITIPQASVTGFNDLLVIARDSLGLAVTYQLGFWAGAGTMNVQVVNESNQPIDGADVELVLNDDADVVSTAKSSAGKITFSNLPDRTFLIEGRTADGRYGSVSAVRSDSPKLVLRPVGTASIIDNNDISGDKNGWNLDADGNGKSPVTIEVHSEALIVTPSNFNSQATNNDIVINTVDQGAEAMSRTFTAKPDTKSVTVRYRFITTEFPTYFNTRFNDSYNVTIRNSGNIASDYSTMNGLGFSAFDNQGRTVWREISLPVGADKLIHVDVAVSNVGDALLESKVVIDYIQENNLIITAAKLNDIDDLPLEYLSASSHSYFSGKTRVHGTLSIEGDAEDQLNAMSLEVLDSGKILARGNLSVEAQAQLFVPFGDDRKIEISVSQLLFELSASQFSTLDQTKNGDLVIRITAKSKNGKATSREIGKLTKLVRYTKTNRFGSRNETRGGDDWVKPSVKTLLDSYTNISIGDISNMNGGSFRKEHRGHRSGNDVSLTFTGYSNNNKVSPAAATTILAQLNNPTYGKRIRAVYVTYCRPDAPLVCASDSSQEFWDAIKNVTLVDGRKASDVIIPMLSHFSNYQWIISD
jgi:hypothetical protein